MESITIIANTGIQLLTRKLTIQPQTDIKRLFSVDFNPFRYSFSLEYAYELEQSKRIVSLYDLQKWNYVDAKGRLIVPEAQVLANTSIIRLHVGNVQPWPNTLFQVNWGNHHCVADKFFNQWIPVPFLRYYQKNDEFDSSSNYWCRCKIIPDTEQLIDGSLTATILLAFDTSSLFQNDDSSENPFFGWEHQKTYRFCNTTNGRLDFCSGESIRNLMELAHGVRRFEDLPFTQEEIHIFDFWASYLWLMEYIADNVDLPEVNLISDQWREKIPVEKVIDVGNSKTAAILFENHSMNESEPLVMQNFTTPVKSDGNLNRTQQPFDMRIAFQRADFGMKWGRFSKQFIWPSMVRLGDEALTLMYQASNQDQNGECLSTYSSPKRYLWDDKAMKEEWQCVKVGAKGKNEWPYIDGISDWFRADGEIGDGRRINFFNLGGGYHYSRKTLMTLAFMEIIAQATMQINSFDYRKNKGHIDAARYIDTVVLTCPIGMSKAERKSLHQCLEDAFYVLGKFYKSQDSTYTKHQIRIAPDLNPSADKPQWMFDGATCAQFVYLYKEIALRYRNNCSVFFDRYGKLRNDLFVKDDTGKSTVYPDKTLTIGSVNIGAGTTDVMICSYKYQTVDQTTLTPVPRYWESFYTAGDDILKEFVQKFVIEGDNSMVAKKLEEQGLEANRINDLIIDFFGSDFACMTFKSRQIRREFCQQISIPIAQRFLELTSEGVEERDLDWDDIFNVNNRPNQLLLDNFAEHFGFGIEKQTWHYDKVVATKLINAVMKGLIKTISIILAEYECDVVLLSGHPVSLPPIKYAFLTNIPVSPNRLIIMDKFRIGFPFVDHLGYSNDSKNTVLLGATIGYLSSNSSLNGFSLDLSVFGKQMEPTTNYFMLLDDKMGPSDSCFITPTCNCGEIMVDSFPKYIGGKYIRSPSYPTRPFYILDINEKEIIKRIKHERQLCGFDDMFEQEIRLLYKQQRDKILKSCPLRFVIERPDFVEDKECLRIHSVEDSNFNLLSPNNFMLSPYSLKDTDCYWLDSGIFNM